MINYKKLNYLFQSHIELAYKSDNHIDKNWLQLQMPKVIYISKSKPNNPIRNLNSTTNSISEVSNDELGLILNKSEKKNKNYNSKLTDTLEYKKNRIKSKKKVRTKIHINDDDESLTNGQNQSNTLDVTQSLALSLMRPSKPVKKIDKLTQTRQRKYNSIPKKSKKKEEVVVSTSKPNKVILTDPISVDDLSIALQIPHAEIIKFLFMKGISVTVNQVVDFKLAESIAEEYGIQIEEQEYSQANTIKYKYDKLDNDNLSKRAPIVTVFGHVDHGKTTLLDTIRSTRAVNLEAGGITQKLEAYQVDIDENQIIFLDTPGHEAFSSTRLLGIQVTDIGVLVVAADDGLQPQSIEAIKFLQKSNIPFVVALNKVDKSASNIQSITESLASFKITNLKSGGNTEIIEISALKNINIDVLLKTIANLAAKYTFQANPKRLASGTILNGYLDKKKGPIADIIVQNGTLHVGDYITSNYFGSKIRTMTNQSMKSIKSVGPSSIVKISGLSSIPQSGTVFEVLEDTKQAKKQLADLQKVRSLKTYQGYQKLNTRITLESPSQKKQSEKKVNIVLKTDSDGSIEAIIQSFSNIPQEKVQINIVSISIGEVNASDINLANVSNSLIISFSANTTSKMRALALKMDVNLKDFQIIYELIEYVEQEMLRYVDIEYNENTIGVGVVENVFVISKGNVAGSMVTEGKLKRNSYIRVKRNGEIIHEGKLNSLKRVKEDVEEVSVGNECGVLCNNFDAWNKKDIINCYELIEQIKTL